LKVPRRLWEQMRDDCQRRSPIEACGLVAGKDGMAVEAFPTVNALSSPVRYRLDPQEQILLMQSIEGSGYEMIAIYHSHPNGPAVPSPTDILEAGYPDSYYLIWCPVGRAWSCRCFTIRDGTAIEASIEVV
jgi:proteasome lid subunit RPN8/RPN11